jgi:uncharacterized spore protein YtfJ
MQDVEALLKATVGELDRLLNARNVLGEPIVHDGGMVIPIVSYGFGFGAGGGGSGAGGTGAGGGIRPLGAIIFDAAGIRVEPVRTPAVTLAQAAADVAGQAMRRRAGRRAAADGPGAEDGEGAGDASGAG